MRCTRQAAFTWGGHEADLSVGEDVVLLGYSKCPSRGGLPTATNTQGVHASALPFEVECLLTSCESLLTTCECLLTDYLRVLTD